MTLADRITRPELALPDLDLNTGPYRIDWDDFEQGAVVWRRQTASSPLVHGEVTTHAVRAQAQGRVGFEVNGATHVELRANLDVLIAAFEQWTWTYHRIRFGVERAWRCEAADWTEGSTYRRERILLVPITFTFPRYPVAL